MGKHLKVYLSDEEQHRLNTLVDSGEAKARTLTRARILLLADRSQGTRRTQKEIAEVLQTTPARVGKICRSYVLEGLEQALYDKPRSGAPPKITGDIEAKLVMLACSEPPDGKKRWTLRLLAEQMVVLGYIDSISNVAVYKRLKKTNLSLGK